MGEGEKDALQASPSRAEVDKEKTEAEEEAEEEKNALKASTSRAEKRPDQTKEEKKEEEAKDGKEEKKEEEAKDGKEGKKEGEEESKMKKERRKNTRSTNKGELITPQPAATKAIEKEEDFPAPEFHLSINATTP